MSDSAEDPLITPSALRCSAQRAMIGEVHPQMRTISITVVQTEIILTVIVDGEISDDLRESVSCIGTEIIADFHPVATTIRELCLRIDSPSPLPKPEAGQRVYQRYEGWPDG